MMMRTGLSSARHHRQTSQRDSRASKRRDPLQTRHSSRASSTSRTHQPSLLWIAHCFQALSPKCLRSDDPCEHQDLSTSQPAILKELLTRLEAFRATSVVSTVAHPNPDGHECPANAVASKGASTPIAPGGCSGAGAQAPMSCGTQLPCTPGHEPPSPPPPPVPTNGRSLRNAQTNKCLLDSLEFGSCGTSSNVWAQAETGALMVGYQMLKILKSPANDGCGGWSTVHMGVGRGDNNTITIVAQHKGSAILASSECSGRCVAVDPEGGVSLGDCSAKTAGGWALQNA